MVQKPPLTAEAVLMCVKLQQRRHVDPGCAAAAAAAVEESLFLLLPACVLITLLSLQNATCFYFNFPPI